MVEQVRVVVIGGGVVGCSCLYHFAEMGWTDAVLLEQSQLTSGSTWHAAGNCPTFATIWGLLKLQQYSAALYRRLCNDVACRGWKSDFESGYSPLEASLDRFVDLTKPVFVGRNMIMAELERGPIRRFVPLALDKPGTADAPYCSTVFAGDEVIGLTTSCIWSYTLNQSIALAYVRSDLTKPGTKLSIDVLGERVTATAGSEPLFDPENSRLRA